VFVSIKSVISLRGSIFTCVVRQGSGMTHVLVLLLPGASFSSAQTFHFSALIFNTHGFFGQQLSIGVVGFALAVL
jgi:hypothetical protein